MPIFSTPCTITLSPSSEEEVRNGCNGALVVRKDRLCEKPPRIYLRGDNNNIII